MKLKQTLTLFLTLLGLTFTLTTSVALAVAATNTNTRTTTTTAATTDLKATNQTTTTADNKTTLSDADKKKLQERLDQRKADIKTKLTTAQKTKLQTKCKAAQGLLSPVRQKVSGFETDRSKAYNDVVSKLTDLSAKVKAKNISTTDLDADITTLQGKVTTFTTDLASYKQAVSDLTDMDCASDPDAFEASLQAARTALDKVNKDATDIRDYIKDTIKPALAAIRTNLGAQKTGSQ